MRPRDTQPNLKVMPRDHETDVPRDAAVLVSAPRPVDQHTVSGVRVTADDQDVEGVLDISSDGRILMWRPARELEARARHQVVITGVRDEKGHPFDAHRSSFVTAVFSYEDLLLGLE